MRANAGPLLLALACLPLLAAAEPAAPPPGADACSGCHAPGPAAGVMPRIHGRSVEEIATALQAFRTGVRAATVMDRIAKGFSEEESLAIAVWLAAVR